MRGDQGEQFAVEVQLMSEPCLWRWDIRDRSQGDVVESSWTGLWMAYESSEEAYHAGAQRLSSLLGR
jgi:hypothetical protein